MFARVTTVAFEGIEARAVDVQVQIGPGLPHFAIVGLPDKAVAESRERVRGALNAIGLALPPKRITVNLAPADLPKEGSHYDLPIVLGLMAATGAVPRDAIEGFCVLGELSLDGSIAAVAGALPVAIGANALGKGLICPASCGAEAAWAAADMTILAPQDLLQLINHFKGLQTLRRPQPTPDPGDESMPDLKDIKGQETAKRALEVAAAGGHPIAGPAHRRDESLPLRPRGRAGLCLPPGQSLRRAIPGAHLRPLARPHRSPDRSPGRLRRRPRSAASVRRKRRDARARDPRPPHPDRALRRARSRPHPHQRRLRRRLLEEIAAPDRAGLNLLREAADALSLSARGYHRTLRVARTLADLDGEENVARIHVAEALSYRGETLRRAQEAA
jgi:magnesium chelatase family protein